MHDYLLNDCNLALQTEALQKLSMMHRLVVSTGGGAVVRPINWYNIEHNEWLKFVWSTYSVGFFMLVCWDNFLLYAIPGNTCKMGLVFGWMCL